jgi:predicted nuclease of restriction endonuclease-like RecB superfamily
VLEEHGRYVGEKRKDFFERMREPLAMPAPKEKLRLALKVLDSLSRGRTAAALAPPQARWLVFRRASAEDAPREVVLRDAALAAGVSPAQLEAALFADLPDERRVTSLPADFSPSRLALESNLMLIGSLLRRAARVRIVAWGNTRALVRQARLSGLICVVGPAPPSLPPTLRAKLEDVDVVDDAKWQGVALDISGPFALFHHTEVYGRALCALVPRAAWCTQFELSAACAIGRGGHTATLVVRSGDPIGSGRELGRYDSRVEERFARDFVRAAPEWDIIREPLPVEANGALIFPDFELVHRRESGRRWLLEIIGFWTPEYLAEKLRRLRAAGIERIVLCIDRQRCCSDEELPSHARVVRYRGRVDPVSVLAIIDPQHRTLAESPAPIPHSAVRAPAG